MINVKQRGKRNFLTLVVGSLIICLSHMYLSVENVIMEDIDSGSSGTVV